MPYALYAVLLFALLSSPACTDTKPPPPGESATTSSQEPTPDTVVRDQIDHTLRQSPEIVTDQDAPPIVPPTTAVAPPAPTNSAPASSAKKSARADAQTASSPSNAPDHDAWNALLQAHVSESGRVDYEQLKGQQDRLDEYLQLLADTPPAADWSGAEKLAYWINAYNAYTVKLILDHYPIASIRDINDPWKRRWIEIGDKTYSLDNIEHDIIRPTFDEPRIHFALVCAAVSCPPLANQAFTAQNLDRMLDRRTRQFLNDERFNVTQEAVVRVTPLFDWYEEDFRPDVRSFINRYLDTNIPAGKEINYLEYDWALND